MGEGLADELFWSPDPVAALDDAAPPRDGLELLAPALVELDARQTLPAVLRRQVALRDDARAPLPLFGAVVAIDLGRDRAYVGRIQEPPDDAPPFREPDAKTLKRMMPATTTQGILVDLRR